MPFRSNAVEGLSRATNHEMDPGVRERRGIGGLSRRARRLFRHATSSGTGEFHSGAPRVVVWCPRERHDAHHHAARTVHDRGDARDVVRRGSRTRISLVRSTSEFPGAEGDPCHAPHGPISECAVSARTLGRATLTSEGAIICPAGQVCPALARLWVINVVVVRSLSAPKVVAVTQLDDGRHVALRIGDRLVVRLRGPTNYTWTVPSSSSTSVVRVVVGVRGSVATSSLVAVSPGTVRVTSSDNPNCYPMCLAPSRLFSLRVTVTR